MNSQFIKIKTKLIKLFNLDSGYVMNFSNHSFYKFIYENIGIDIKNDYPFNLYNSKAKKLIFLFDTLDPFENKKLIINLLNHFEVNKDSLKYKLPLNYRQLLDDVYLYLANLKEEQSCLKLDNSLEALIKSISTRKATFSEMTMDEKIKELANLMENLLKDGEHHFIKISYESLTFGMISTDSVNLLRHKSHAFRHSSRESLKERANYSDTEKNFLVNFGVLICNLVINAIKDQTNHTKKF